MDKIPCQNIHSANNGCSVCGGFRVRLEKSQCSKCKREYWDYIRNGETGYDGKKFQAFDGLRMEWRLDGVLCCYCAEKHPLTTQHEVQPTKEKE